jgi:NCAIR mutase (PurE)-related protein
MSQREELNVKVRRLIDAPIIAVATDVSLGEKTQGAFVAGSSRLGRFGFGAVLP